mgnify:CR=1 FL=1
MNILVRRQWNPFELINREMNRLFDMKPEERDASGLLLNLYESGDAYYVKAELPGVKPDDIQIEVTGELLKVSGERKGIENVDDEHFRRQERWVGRWSRELTFPKRVNADDVTADMAHGLLTVRVAKAESEKPRRITVRPSEN